MPVDMLDVTITHPRLSRFYEATVKSSCPASVVLTGLQSDTATDKGPFLDPAPAGRPYVLVHARTGKQLNPDTTIGEAGVVDGDELQVHQLGQGA